MGAGLYSPGHIIAIDLADTRLEAAKQFGRESCPCSCVAPRRC
jgi:alcohol dehydrogenase